MDYLPFYFLHTKCLVYLKSIHGFHSVVFDREGVAHIFLKPGNVDCFLSTSKDVEFSEIGGYYSNFKLTKGAI